jgi:hypothetical protein
MLDIIADKLWELVTWFFGWKSDIPEGSVRAPRCFGSAAIVCTVSATALNRIV